MVSGTHHIIVEQYMRYLQASFAVKESQKTDSISANMRNIAMSQRYEFAKGPKWDPIRTIVYIYAGH